MIRRILLAVAILSALAPAFPAAAGEAFLRAFGLEKRADSGVSFAPFRQQKLLDVALIPEAPMVDADKPFRLIMRFNHASNAYTYWTNPGGPGQSARISWGLPPGFLVGSPSWPAPVKSDNNGIVSYVHKGNALAVFTVTPPPSFRPGDMIAITAELDIQVCTPRTCTPERIVVETNVQAAGKTGSVTPLLEQAQRALPRPLECWEVTPENDQERFSLLLAPGEGANPEPGDIYFFDDSPGSPVVDSQLPQPLEKDGGRYRLVLPLREGANNAARLTGLLHARDGWLSGDRNLSVFSVSLPLSDPAPALAPASAKTAHDAALLLLFAFVGGVLLNVMPCVFPVISLKVMGFAKQAHKDRRSVFLHGVAYAAGVLLCFWALAILVISLGRGWGAQLQSAVFVYALCHLFVIMSLNMAGVFEVGAGAASAGRSLSGSEGLRRSFLTGLLATVISTPCSAPFLGSALAYALSLPASLAMGVFTLMGFGFALPYLLLALFPGWLARLPKPGQWMETFRQAMSFPLFATAGYMLWTLEAMVDEWRLLMTVFGLIVSAFACWLYGKGRHAAQARTKRTKSRICTALAALFLVWGVWLGYPSADPGLEWRDWSPELVRELRNSGKAVYVDFTARWCATCQVNKRVYRDPGIAELIDQKDVVLLKADWTQYDERITRTLRNEFNKAAVPVTALYVPGEKTARVLPELLTSGNVSEELAALP